MRTILFTLCIMISMTGCGQAANKFSKDEKNAVLDTLANNFSTDIVGWATENEPSDELVIASMSLISDPRLLEEYKETRGISDGPGETKIDNSVRLKIEDYSLIDEKNDSLKIELTGQRVTMNYDRDEDYFLFLVGSLREKDNELYFTHAIALYLDAPFKQLRGYINVVVYFPEKNMERKVRVPVNVSIYDNPDD